MHHSLSVAINTNREFELEYAKKADLLLMTGPVNRGPAHATKDDTMARTHEIMHLTEVFSVDRHQSAWARVIDPNLPWAEDHFKERIGGEPLNPAPSEQWWPFARAGNAEHKKDQKFSHTYPERFWPKHAGDIEDQAWDIDSPTSLSHFGIRFKYGDLSDLIVVLSRNPNSRQAYLPVWFPEDLHAALLGERVPCSMGYHFIVNGITGRLDCVYTMRPCDVVRFYRDDVYMAGRLLQHVANKVELNLAQQGAGSAAVLQPGNLVVHIDNLHCFPDDKAFLESVIEKHKPKDKRASYNFDAL